MNSPQLLERFRQNALFQGLDPEVLRKIDGHLLVEHFAPEQIIFHEDEEGDSLYLIGEGVVRISKQGRGDQQETLSFLEAGDFFGDMAAFSLAPRSARATAVGDVVAGRLDRIGLDALLKLAPLPLVENFATGLIRRLRSTNDHFVSELIRAERLSLIGAMAGGIVHDLRNLINPARGYIQLLRNRTSDPELLRWIERSDRSIGQMLGLVQELLEFSRGASPALRLEQVDVHDFVDEFDEQYLQTIGNKIRVERRIDYSGPFRADRFRLMRVFVNVAKNAVEAMPDGGTLTIVVAAQDEQVCFTISDTGRGITPEMLPRIFEPFVTEGKEHGTGLGMAITRSVIDAHRGRIAVDSIVGQGTNFRIWLPQDGSDGGFAPTSMDGS